jgi:hypothetical protein
MLNCSAASPHLRIFIQNLALTLNVALFRVEPDQSLLRNGSRGRNAFSSSLTIFHSGERGWHF